jgi:ubiquinone/menaquinone biosynthesis C-methylase UbiE
MNVQEAYKIWSEQYDTNLNKTRDLEASSLRNHFKELKFNNCLEIGCGTGKNTLWLTSIADNIIAIDFSEEMLAKAKEKVTAKNVKFIQADINKTWSFTGSDKYDLAIFSLVLEHIENLDNIFQKLSEVLLSNATVYIGELHPYKQYNGTKARFETTEGIQEVTSFNHHISDFVNAAKKYNFLLTEISEYFDDNDKSTIPRILSIIFKKI